MGNQYRENYKKLVDKNANKYNVGNNADIVRFEDKNLLLSGQTSVSGVTTITMLDGVITGYPSGITIKGMDALGIGGIAGVVNILGGNAPNVDGISGNVNILAFTGDDTEGEVNIDGTAVNIGTGDAGGATENIYVGANGITTFFRGTSSAYIQDGVITASNGFRHDSNGAKWTIGTGSPEGVVVATPGSLYTRSDGSANNTLYVKDTGTGNTGWSAMAIAG